jgi:hypothetical protein
MKSMGNGNEMAKGKGTDTGASSDTIADFILKDPI